MIKVISVKEKIHKLFYLSTQNVCEYGLHIFIFWQCLTSFKLDNWNSVIEIKHFSSLVASLDFTFLVV